jgi:hypothetical protein
MSFDKLLAAASRFFYLSAFVLLALAVLEKIANSSGYTILRLYRGGRLLEFAGVLLLFVMAAQLKEIKDRIKAKS